MTGQEQVQLVGVRPHHDLIASCTLISCLPLTESQGNITKTGPNCWVKCPCSDFDTDSCIRIQ